MIEYQFPEEKELLLKYAAQLADSEAKAVLVRGTIESAAQVEVLAKFFWRMIDASIEDDDAKYWAETILNTLRAACIKAGYAEVWDDATPID